MNFYTENIEKILAEFGSDAKNGLTAERIKQNEARFGKNEFTKEKPKSMLSRVLEAAREPMLLILVFALFITVSVNVYRFFSGGHAEIAESAGVFAAIVLSVAITVIMEGRSEKAFEALNKIKENILVRATRNGEILLVPQKDIVAGDIVSFETGDKLPVDCRIIDSIGLSSDESSLTGESLPVKKSAAELDEKTPLAERFNMLYSGCYISGGQCRAVVTAVGDATEFGKIASELKTAGGGSTPLQEKLTRLGKTISIIGGVVAAIVFVSQLWRLLQTGTATFESVADIFITSIVLIVAAVPEGLPTIVAVSLALNIIKMARENALVRKLVACETIGCINIICSDKTGTLTENKMSVVRSERKNEAEMLKNFVLNSTAELDKKGDCAAIGNPTECALLVEYQKKCNENSSLVSCPEIRGSAVRVHVYPFSSEQKCMTSIYKDGGIVTAYSKGSPEKIISFCAIDDKIRAELAEYEKKISDCQSEAMRVLAFAHKNFEGNFDFENDRALIEKDMIFDGFVAIADPLRKDVYAAVDDCRRAGIGIKMLTGDNVVTARAIAKQLGMLDDDSIVTTAAEVEAMSDGELEKCVDKIRVIARSTPSTKLRVVNMLKKLQNVVAVTGDGINDAPAIKSADVGIAMGITGTEVSKEAADIVLLDDSFSTIVKAVRWGRGIYENFQRFIRFQLTVNFSAVLAVLASVFGGFAAPFTTLQLLWINIIMDGPPALTLGLEPMHDDLMSRKPTERGANIVSRSMLWGIVANGLIITILFLWQRTANILGAAPEQESTVLFTVFVLFQLFNAFNCRELGNESAFKKLFANPAMLFVFSGTFLLQFFITQYGGAAFKTVPLGAFMWLKMFVFASLVLFASEFARGIRRKL